jgi:hypothetical protein
VYVSVVGTFHQSPNWLCLIAINNSGQLLITASQIYSATWQNYPNLELDEFATNATQINE